MVTPTADDPLQAGVLELLYLASPTLPVGAYAYSQGLEAAVCGKFVFDVESAASWIGGLMDQVLARVDVPILARLYRAWQMDDAARLRDWSELLLAQREARELRDEEIALGRALARLLRDLGFERARALLDPHHLQASPRTQRPDAGVPPTWLGAFALAAWSLGIPLEATVHGYLYAWTENQFAAATRLIPLGQTEARRALLRSLPVVASAARAGLALPDAEIGASAPGLALCSALHETQYTRLFRS